MDAPRPFVSTYYIWLARLASVFMSGRKIVTVRLLRAPDGISETRSSE
jgi:hypothetical protein